MQAQTFYLFCWFFSFFVWLCSLRFVLEICFSVGDFVSAFWFHYLTHKPNVWLLPVDDEFRIYIFSKRKSVAYPLHMNTEYMRQGSSNRGLSCNFFVSSLFLLLKMLDISTLSSRRLKDNNILYNLTYGWLLTMYRCTVYTSVFFFVFVPSIDLSSELFDFGNKIKPAQPSCVSFLQL